MKNLFSLPCCGPLLAAENLAQSKWTVVAAAMFAFYVTYEAFMHNIEYVRKIIFGELSQDSQDSLLDSESLRGRVLDASDIKARRKLREKTMATSGKHSTPLLGQGSQGTRSKTRGYSEASSEGR